MRETEPITFQQAMEEVVWLSTMQEELLAIERNDTWEVANLSEGKQLIPLDVKSAFLNGPLEEVVYITQPLGFEVTEYRTKVLELNKALYGETILLCLYVDDLVIIGNSEAEILKLKEELKSEFEMIDLGELAYFLGLEFLKTKTGMVMYQGKYIANILKRFHMSDCKLVTVPIEGKLGLNDAEIENPTGPTLYRQIVGCLRFICHSRPEIGYGVGVINMHMANPKLSHMIVAKRILRYLKGTLHFGILFPNQRAKTESCFVGYSDSDWCGDKEDRKSTSGYVFFIFDAPISWSSKKQDVVVISTCEAEYIAACNAACQGLWLTSLISELKCGEIGKFELRVDNKSTINLAKNPVSHERYKHIETKFHFLRDQVEKENVKLIHCATKNQIADVLTKRLEVCKV
ncbi:PREDICTED: uncharacterized protein LOC109350471 [Lupinus angustifolius]|uniref:uncharacterized protein LOC109350471 n=1 Tax=Lupinus angustifolius TaxID=3871 RepID=UPI00092E3881|nr:PREDICTED: uncharacterized protein LOC109350471 [Lupinus angustifolius]